MEDLSSGLVADAAAATVAAITVAPLVSAIDRAVAEQAAGTRGLWPSLFSSISQILTNPAAYARSPQFLYIAMVYAGTCKWILPATEKLYALTICCHTQMVL